MDLIMLKKEGMKKNNLSNIAIYIFLILLGLNFINGAEANPTQIIKNVICKENSVFKNYLENNQDEKLSWLGVSQDGSTITELYISSSTNSWTILETDTNGISCATIGGKDSKNLINK